MGRYEIICARCGMTIPRDVYYRVCPRCGGEITFHYDLDGARLDRDLPGVWRFIDLLPVEDAREIVTLQEGNTPLLASNLSGAFGIDLYWNWKE